MMQEPECLLGFSTRNAGPLSPAIFRIATQLASEFLEAAELLDERICSPRVIEQMVLDPLLARCTSVANAIPLTPYPSESSSKEELSSFLTNDPTVQDIGSNLVFSDALARHDSYFRTRRLGAMTADIYTRQLAKTLALFFSDSRHCTLDTIHLRDILVSSAWALCDAADNNEVRSRDGANVFDQNAVPLLVAHDDVLEEASWRWKNGHHLFNLLCTRMAASLSLLDPMLDSMTLGNAERVNAVADTINRISILLRGTTAAMWYAEAFPMALYTRHLRPQMRAASSDDQGFSGKHNLEFLLFLRAFGQLERKLRDVIGRDGGVWPASIKNAMANYYEARILDLEHHTILAEKVVGQKSSSLAEEIVFGAAGDTEGGSAAVDTLRQLAAQAVRAKGSFLSDAV